MKRLSYLFAASLLFLASAVSGQDTLPRFSVRNLGADRVVIGWTNTFPVVKQISIQRSHDSLKNYKTILSVADPSAVQNGFADTKAPNDHMYYRLFVNLDSGRYFFTVPQQPSRDTGTGVVTLPSAGSPGRDTATRKPPVIRRPEFVPSYYVYTNREGYVFINLPDADKQKYRIRFFEENDAFLFELKTISETALTLDKANFLHAGWFKFELYNDEKLVERNKFFLAKDF